MKMNIDALKALELKLDEFSKTNGSIAEHESANANSIYECPGSCKGSCNTTCYHGCKTGKK